MVGKRPKGFLVLNNPNFQITDSETCLQVEEYLKKNKLISPDKMVYYSEENRKYYTSYYDEDKKQYFAKSLNITYTDYKDALQTNDVKFLQELIQNSPDVEHLAIPLEYVESYSDSNQNANNVQSSERVPSNDMPQIDISEQELKKIKKDRDSELNKQLLEINQQTLYQMLLQVRASRNIEEMKSKKKEVEKLFENTWFTDKDIEFFWNNIAPGIIRRGPQR